MQEKKHPNIVPDKSPEIEQPDIKEFEEYTPHPDDADVEVKSEQIRYENTDTIYE